MVLPANATLAMRGPRCGSGCRPPAASTRRRSLACVAAAALASLRDTTAVRPVNFPPAPGQQAENQTTHGPDVDHADGGHALDRHLLVQRRQPLRGGAPGSLQQRLELPFSDGNVQVLALDAPGERGPLGRGGELTE